MYRLALIFVLGCLGCSEYDVTSIPNLNPPIEAATDLVEPIAVHTGDSDEPVWVAYQQPIYANTKDALYSVDPDTLEATFLGTLRRGFQDIAANTRGELYGGVDGDIYRIRLYDGYIQKVCSLGNSLDFVAMTFSSDDTLYSSDGSSIYEIDLTSCVLKSVMDFPEYTTSGDLVNVSGGLLYWTVRGESSDSVVEINLNKGTTALIGPARVEKIFGLSFYDGDLFYFSSNGEITRSGIDTDLTSSRPSELSWWGAATNPYLWK